MSPNDCLTIIDSLLSYDFLHSADFYFADFSVFLGISHFVSTEILISISVTVLFVYRQASYLHGLFRGCIRFEPENIPGIINF